MTNDNIRRDFEINCFVNYGYYPTEGQLNERWLGWKAGYITASKRYSALVDAVIILPDDAEPEVGDIVISDKGFSRTFDFLDMTGTETINGKAWTWKDYKKLYGVSSKWVRKNFTIIQRNGKPVIYQSALAAGMGEG